MVKIEKAWWNQSCCCFLREHSASIRDKQRMKHGFTVSQNKYDLVVFPQTKSLWCLQTQTHQKIKLHYSINGSKICELSSIIFVSIIVSFCFISRFHIHKAINCSIKMKNNAIMTASHRRQNSMIFCKAALKQCVLWKEVYKYIWLEKHSLWSFVFVKPVFSYCLCT